jgi:hypothetical protein
MITIEEFLNKKHMVGMTELIAPIMIEFAQLHVAEALKQASLTRRNGFYDSEKEEKEILNAYPLTNIK